MPCADEIPLLSASIAISLAKNMTTNELNFYGNLLAAIAAEMMTIASYRDAGYAP